MNAKRIAIVIAVSILAAVPVYAAGDAGHCSTAGAAGKWTYTYIGTIFTVSGPFPLAAVGHVTLDGEGNLTGDQARSVAGSSGYEDLAGTFSVNKDCTGSTTIGVYVNGQLQRTAVLAVAFDNNMNHIRGIFQSLNLPDGTNVPVVITLDETRQFPKK
jgi:hypothetical protein